MKELNRVKLWRVMECTLFRLVREGLSEEVNFKVGPEG